MRGGRGGPAKSVEKKNEVKIKLSNNPSSFEKTKKPLTASEIRMKEGIGYVC